MSVVFNGSTQYAFNANAIVGTYPFSMLAWFYDTSGTGNGGIIACETNGSNDNRHSILGLSTEILRLQRRTTVTNNANTTSAYGLNAWHNVIATFTAANDVSIWLDNGSVGTSTLSMTPSGMDRFFVAVAQNLGLFWTGRLAEIALWDFELTSTDRTDLQTKNCQLIDSGTGNLQAYWPLGGTNFPDDWEDKHASFDLTTVASPTFNSSHPSLTYPTTGIEVFRRRLEQD